MGRAKRHFSILFFKKKQVLIKKAKKYFLTFFFCLRFSDPDVSDVPNHFQVAGDGDELPKSQRWMEYCNVIT